MTFEWDARKAAANLKKHSVAFEDAATVFLDPLATTYADPDHSLSEQREITVGHTLEGHLIFERDGKIRIISAHLPTAIALCSREAPALLRLHVQIAVDILRNRAGIKGLFSASLTRPVLRSPREMSG
ncbi:MAG: BrnT family toxin [Bryobacteraceae bacterium]|nr:BrnT family toxin [Bryobacteraceae bacterium]